jgi:ElaB/YqjD/DUF883 family membrane-anchored ribosome-binding protein
MFGTHLQDRRSKPERIADQAWEYLLSAAGSAKDTARSAGQRTSHVADDATSLVGSAADEAMRRATAAYDALAGRRSPTPWALIAVAGLVGAAIGWAAGNASRAALARMGEPADARDTDRIEFVETDRPVSLDN